MWSLSESMVRMSGVELAGTGVSVGIGVLVFVGCKVNVGWMLVSVGLGLAHPPRKSTKRRNIPTTEAVEDLFFTDSFPYFFVL